MDLVISDIHADLDALNTILDTVSSEDFKKKYGKFSRIINLGDVLERGLYPGQVLSRLQDLAKNYSIHSVIGNHDEGFLSGKKVSASSLESISAHDKLTDQELLSFFKQNKDGTFGSLEFVDTKNGLFCVHGGPLDPKKITPKNAYEEEAWLYQRNWQRLTDEDFEFFSYHGYHYKASSAFDEVKNHVDNHVILCGHQHMETAISNEAGKVKEIYSEIKPGQEKISGYILEKREIEIKKNTNYFIRLGLGGPAGYYGVGKSVPHFGIIQYDPKKVILFNVNT